MAKAKDIIKSVANYVLAIGCFAVFNENPENLWPNFIGLACFGLLIYINKDNN